MSISDTIRESLSEELPVTFIKRELGVSSTNAMLEAIANAIDKEKSAVLPEWPVFDDGSPVGISDAFDVNGREDYVESIVFSRGSITIHGEGNNDVVLMDGAKLKRSDSVGKIYYDATLSLSAYWDCDDRTCDECPNVVDGERPYERFEVDNCVKAMTIDLLDRMRAATKAGRL